VIYHIDDEDTPYLVKLPVGPEKVTLGDFKNVLNRPNFKFFFKSMDDDFGVVKEEIVEDECPLPCFNGRVVSWLVSADTSILSDSGSQCGTESIPPGVERGPGVGETRPPSFHGGPPTQIDAGWPDETGTELESSQHPTDTFDDTESSITSVSQIGRRKHERHHRIPGLHGGGGMRPHQLRTSGGVFRNDAASSVLSSEIDSSYFDTEDNESMASSRFTTSTEATSVSRQHANRMRKQKRLRHKKPTQLSRASSISSITDSTLSLNIITVNLNMDTVNFLGISIVGQSNQGGDGGIYVGSIMKGGAVALDARIEPGDMILQVNDINFENMTNDDAVRVLRDVVQKPGPIKLVVAKCWDPNPKDYFNVPKTEPVRPIDPGAWVAHTAAVRGLEMPQPPPSISGFMGGGGGVYHHGRAPSVTTLTSSSPSLASTVQEKYTEGPLTIQSGMKAICCAMQRTNSGLEVRDRLWLKITIHQAFIGSEVVNWLFTKVQGFTDKREAKKYASQMLKAGFIKHTVNKSSFSEQCYYTFGDIATALANCNLKDSDGTLSDPDRDTLGPLPTPQQQTGWTPNAPPPSFYQPAPTHPAPAPPYPGNGLGGPSPGGVGGLGPIYNPAPPPSTYMTFYQDPSSGNTTQQSFINPPGPQERQGGSGRSPSSSSGHTAGHIELAASGSGSESEEDMPPPPTGLINQVGGSWNDSQPSTSFPLPMQ